MASLGDSNKVIPLEDILSRKNEEAFVKAPWVSMPGSKYPSCGDK